MEIQLQELIDQIKKDGVQTAEAEAKNIISSANFEAERIIADAQAQAEKILLTAKSENERIVKSGEDAIRQAGRNLLISFRESITRELKAVVGENVAAVYSSDALSEIIINAVEALAADNSSEDMSVVLNSRDMKKFEENILAGLKERMLKGVTIKPNDNFDGGFRISVNNGEAYYDYSADEVVNMLSNYLSPKVTTLLKEAE